MGVSSDIGVKIQREGRLANDALAAMDLLSHLETLFE